MELRKRLFDAECPDALRSIANLIATYTVCSREYGIR
jgi:hypothetical protein